jgi:hypothetical protein
VRGDAVVDGDDQVGAALRRDPHDLGRKPVAVVETVGHEIADICAQGAQAEQGDGAGGGAVGVVVGNNQELLAALDGVGESGSGGLDVAQRMKIVEFAQFRAQRVRRADAARGIEASQQGGMAGAFEGARVGRIVGAGDQCRQGVTLSLSL